MKNEIYTDLEELAMKYKATDKLVLIQRIGELEKKVKELAFKLMNNFDYTTPDRHFKKEKKCTCKKFTWNADAGYMICDECNDRH